METRNIYSYPIDEKNIARIITTESESHRIFKEKNSSFDLSRAVDFLCNEGTPVKAALEGKIVKIRNTIRRNHDELGLPSKDIPLAKKEDDNHVIIKHLHDEFSICSHLVFHGTKNYTDQIVKSGDLMGFSGRADFDDLSCVHFMVYRLLAPQPSKDLQSLQIRWNRV